MLAFQANSETHNPSVGFTLAPKSIQQKKDRTCDPFNERDLQDSKSPETLFPRRQQSIFTNY